jgi:plastocyanin
MHRFTIRLAFAVTAALLAVGFLAVPAGAADRTVRIVSSDYAPDPVRITVGERVTWLNGDSLPHDASGNGWSTPLLLNGQRASVRFTAVGTYAYTCTIHPAMSGRVVVRAAGSGATTPPTDPAPSPPAATGTAPPIAPILLAAASAVGLALALRRTARTR